MKKILAAAICIMLLFASCSDEKDIEQTNLPTLNESDIASYIGEGQMTMLRMLVNSNASLVCDVFIGGHLPADLSNIITNGDGSFAPVTADNIKTYDDLKDLLNSTYTASVAEKILTSPAKYVEIDGKLYLNIQYEKSENYEYDWDGFEIKMKESTDDKYVFDIIVKDADGKSASITACAVDEGGNLRLDNMYS